MDRENDLMITLRQNRGNIALVGGALLAIVGLRKRSLTGLALAVAGGALVAEVWSRRQRAAASPDAPLEATTPVWKMPIRVRRSITIGRPREEVFAFWREFENLPRFMRHLENVERIDDRTSRWTARAPIGTVNWEAQITAETENAMIAWQSLTNAQVENHGVVTFADAPGGRGTEVTVELEYMPPAGKLGAAVAKMFGEEPDGQVRDDLNRLRALLEAGEVPTIDGQPSDRVRKAKTLIGTRLLGASMPEEERVAS